MPAARLAARSPMMPLARSRLRPAMGPATEPVLTRVSPHSRAQILGFLDGDSPLNAAPAKLRGFLWCSMGVPKVPEGICRAWGACNGSWGLFRPV